MVKRSPAGPRSASLNGGRAVVSHQAGHGRTLRQGPLVNCIHPERFGGLPLCSNCSSRAFLGALPTGCRQAGSRGSACARLLCRCYPLSLPCAISYLTLRHRVHLPESPPSSTRAMFGAQELADSFLRQVQSVVLSLAARFGHSGTAARACPIGTSCAGDPCRQSLPEAVASSSASQTRA